MESVLIFLTVLGAAAIVDFLWVICAIEVNGDNIARAIVASVLLAAVSINVVTAVIDNRWMQIPYLIGTAVGTLGAMLYSRRKNKFDGRSEVPADR